MKNKKLSTIGLSLRQSLLMDFLFFELPKDGLLALL